jgi:uncharacterized repeat protein (TIGR02543 family)
MPNRSRILLKSDSARRVCPLPWPLLLAFCLLGGGIATAQVSYYLSPTGTDSGSCGKTVASPCQSVAYMQTIVQKASKNQPIIVYLADGTYYLTMSQTNPGKTLNFTAADSGGSASNLVTWTNAPGANPAISGGVLVGAGGLGLTWTHGANNLWTVTLPANIGGNPKNPLQNFEYLYYNGERRLRGRLQSANGVGYYMSGGVCHSTNPAGIVDPSLCSLGTFLRVSKIVDPTSDPNGESCPNVASTKKSEGTKCLDRFYYDAKDAAVMTVWKNLNPSNTTWHTCSLTSNRYPQGDVTLTLFDAWTVDMMRVACIDTTKRIVYLTGAVKGLPNAFDYFGPMPGHRYVVENARDALDTAAGQGTGTTGIWFLDRSAGDGNWVLNYIANNGEDPNTDTIVIAQLGPATPLGGSLFSATNLNNVTFKGIAFEVDNYVPPPTGYNDDETSDDTLPEALDCESCQNVVFDTVTVRHTSATGLQIASTSGKSGPAAKNDIVRNSSFYDLGDNGIHIGHAPNWSDLPANVVQFVTVQNNIVQGYSRVFADGRGITEANGHDITYLHNDVTDGYHGGMSACYDGCAGGDSQAANGTNIVSKYNHIWNVMEGLTSDGGALYYNTGSATGAGTGNYVLNNLIHDVTDSSIIDSGVIGSGYGGHGIYLDAQTAGAGVENNVVFRVNGGAVHITQGPAPGLPANTFKNNLLAYATLDMFEEINPWVQGCVTPSLRFSAVNNIFYFDRDHTSGGFHVVEGCDYSCGLSYNQFQNFDGNLYWRTDGKFSTEAQQFHIETAPPGNETGCDGYGASTYFNFATWQSNQSVSGVSWNGAAAPPGGMNEDTNGTVTTNPAFGSTGAATDFCLPSSCLGGTIVGNLDTTKTNDTILHAGRDNPQLCPPVPGTVPATFPTYSNAPIPLTIATQPAGLQVAVDGTAAGATPAVANLSQGGMHVLSVASATQHPQPGEQDVFLKWSDGTTSTSDAITVPATAKTYTATFQTSYQLNIGASPAAGGAVTPATGNYNGSGTVVTIKATANAGYTFAGWTGNVADPTSATTTVTMNQPQTVTATFNSGLPTPEVTWLPNPLPGIVDGTNLASSLTATASDPKTHVALAGTYAYTANGTTVTAATVLAPGNYNLSVAFTPADTVDYNTAGSATNTLTVTKPGGRRRAR